MELKNLGKLRQKKPIEIHINVNIKMICATVVALLPDFGSEDITILEDGLAFISTVSIRVVNQPGDATIRLLI